MTTDRELLEACKHPRVQSFRFADGAAAPLWGCADCSHKFVPINLPMEQDAERYRWLRDHPMWSVGYRIKPRSGMKEWRMRDDDGDYWGNWWPTHEQAVDHAMAAQKEPT